MYQDNRIRLFVPLVLLVFVSAYKNLWFVEQITWGMTSTEKSSLLFFSLAFFLFYWAIPILFRRRNLFILLGSLLIVWGLVSFWYYLYFHRYPQFNLLISLSGQTKDLLRTGSIPFYPQLVWMLIEIPLFVLLYYLSGWKWNFLGLDRRFFAISITLLLVLLGAGSCHFFRSADSPKYAEDLKYYGDAVFVRRHGLLLWQIKKAIQKDPRLSYAETKLVSDGRGERKNIILIQVESLDSAIVRHEWQGRPVMPFLEGLSRKHVYYPVVMSYHKGGGTSDAELSIVNSVDPFPDRPTIMDDSISYSNSFVRKLRDAGYLTLAYHGNTGKFWNRSSAFPAMGYERFVDTFGIPLEQVGWGIPDHLFFPYILEELKGIAKSNRPFFAHIITMSTHEPFQLVQEYHENARFDSITDPVTRGFFLSMDYVDEVLSRIIPELMKIPDTEIILVGDHASIEMDGFMCSRVKQGPMLLDFVPLLLISSEADERPETINTAASFMDLGITVLELSGIPYSLHTKGLSLLGSPKTNTLIYQDNLSWTRNNLHTIWEKRSREIQ